MIHKKSDVTFGGTCLVPKDRYTVRIVKATKKTSASGNLMVELQVEIVAPDEVEVGGQKFSLAGRKHTMYPLLDPSVAWGIGSLIEALEKSNFDFSKFNDEGEFDDDKLGLLIGHTMDMILDSEEAIARRDRTQEQIQNKQPGSPILDGEGKEIKMGVQIIGNLSNVVGPGSMVATNPY